MRTEPGTYELNTVLSEHLDWHGARISFLATFLLAILKVRTVNLAQLAVAFSGCAQISSKYNRLQRFFCSFEFNQNDIARLVVLLIPVGNGPWRLTMDRTNWKFGKTNFLVRIVALPYPTDPDRLSKMMALLTLVFAWAYRMGEVLHDGDSPIPLKKPYSAILNPFFAMD